MVPLHIRQALERRVSTNSALRRSSEEKSVAANALRELSISLTDEIGAFLSEYNLMQLSQREGIELLDVCFPGTQIANVTDWLRAHIGLSADLICLDTAEGEGCVLYSKRNKKIYDVSFWEASMIETHEIQPRWGSFFELLEWYLDVRA